MVCLDFEEKMESYDETSAHVPQPSGISKLKTEHRLTLDDLMESNDRTGITLETRNRGMEQTI